MLQLWTELKRRNVVRVAGIYIIASWVILQVLDTVGDFLSMPLWVGRAAIILILLFFPLAIYLGWAFTLTKGGVFKHQSSHAAKPVGALDYVTIIVLMAVLGGGAYQLFQQQDKLFAEPQTSVPRQEVRGVADNSIAVLPFVNMSSDPEQEYFSDGITEEILNVLARMPGLQVTSRTSAFSFKGKIIPIPEIAAELGVAYVLEGSVRKSGNRVRITAQLIQVGSDSHLFSDTWDRDLTDVFAVQDEISGLIGDILQLKLVDGGSARSSGAEATVLSAAVLDDYLLATQLMATTNFSNSEQAVALLSDIIEVAPDFSQARSRLANVYLMMLQVGQKITPAEAIRKATVLAEEALVLEPTNAEAMIILSYTKRNEGDLIGSDRLLEQALSLEPGNAIALRQVLSNHMFDRELVRVDDLAERLLRVDPRSETTLLILQDYYRRSGNLELARNMMERMKVLDNAAIYYMTLMDVNDYHGGGPEGTLDYVTQVYDLEPRFAESAARFVTALLDTGNVEEAAELLESSPGFDEFLFPKHWSDMIYRMYTGDQAVALSLAQELAKTGSENRYASRANALRILLIQSIRRQRGYSSLIDKYLAAFPDLGEYEVPNSGAIPPIFVKYGHFMAANDLALIYALSGEDTKSEKLNESIRAALLQWPRSSVLGYGIADVELLARTGDTAGALHALPEALDDDWHHLWWFHLDHNPNLDNIRDLPEFQTLRARFSRFDARQ